MTSRGGGLRRILFATITLCLVSAQQSALSQPLDISSGGAPTEDQCAKFQLGELALENESPAALAAGARQPAPSASQALAPSPSGYDSTVEEIVVTGYRASLRFSLARKGTSGIIADDISSFPDREAYANVVANPIKQAATAPVSTFSIDVDTASYANVRRFLNDGAAPPADAVRVEEMLNYFDYGYPLPAAKAQPFRPFVSVAPSPWASGKQLIHIGVQGFKPSSAARLPLNLVFLIDTSGSMESDDRLPLAKKALDVLIDQLQPQDRVAMVAYAGSAGAVLAPTSGREKLKMRCALQALESGGSTAGSEGLELAYELAEQNFSSRAINRVILLTDGDFNVGVTDDERLEDFVASKRKTGVYLSIYGFGRGNYQDERMQVLAQNGNGTAAYIDTLDEGRKVFRDDFSSNMIPIADDVKIQVEFNPATVAEYRLIGYETRMLEREDFNNDAVDAGDVGAGASVTALYEITPVGAPASVDPLRYGAPSKRARPSGAELAFLKIRYKTPGGTTSRLIETPILRGSATASIEQAPPATRWAAAVAAYGMKLRRDVYVPDAYDWDQVLALAQGARGADEFGLRAEFIGLIRKASNARTAP